jgi:hypothetical protein
LTHFLSNFLAISVAVAYNQLVRIPTPWRHYPPRRRRDPARFLMLTLFGRNHKQCDGVSRRDFLRVGALGLGGLTLADLLRLKAQGAVAPKSAHKAVIMIFLSGGPSHIDTYDMKPNAPVDIRGEFNPIKTTVPGLDICELMPRQAQMAKKLASPGSKASPTMSSTRNGPRSAPPSVVCTPANP